MDTLIQELCQNAYKKQEKKNLMVFRRPSEKETMNSVHIKMQAFDLQKIMTPRKFEKFELKSIKKELQIQNTMAMHNPSFFEDKSSLYKTEEASKGGRLDKTK